MGIYFLDDWWEDALRSLFFEIPAEGVVFNKKQAKRNCIFITDRTQEDTVAMEGRAAPIVQVMTERLAVISINNSRII